MENKSDKVEMFIELRARGNSFDKIAGLLKVSKSTLISWSKTYHLQLMNYKNIKADAIMEKYKMSQNHQLEALGERLQKVREELTKRDLSKVSTTKLVEMEIKLFNAINNNNSSQISFKEPGWDDIDEYVVTWDT